MSEKHGRAVLGALILGALLAVGLEVVWPGAWHRGSTPRFLVTVTLAALAAAVWVVRRRS